MDYTQGNEHNKIIVREQGDPEEIGVSTVFHGQAGIKEMIQRIRNIYLYTFYMRSRGTHYGICIAEVLKNLLNGAILQP